MEERKREREKYFASQNVKKPVGPDESLMNDDGGIFLLTFYSFYWFHFIFEKLCLQFRNVVFILLPDTYFSNLPH